MSNASFCSNYLHNLPTKTKKKDRRNENRATRLEEATVELQVEEGLQRTGMTVKKPLNKRIQPLTPPIKSKARYKKNQLFMGGLFIISMFYAVTVLQTAFHAQRVQYETGKVEDR